MTEKNINYDYRLTEIFGMRYTKNIKHPLTGWLRVENRSIYDTVRIHFDHGAPTSNYDEVAPRSSKCIQCEDGVQWNISSAASGTQIYVSYSLYKPTEQNYQDFPEVQNGNLSASIVATATIAATTLGKGYGTHIDCSVDPAAGEWTVELSRDNGVTYDPAVSLTHTDPSLIAWADDKLYTHARFTRAGGTLTYYIS